MGRLVVLSLCLCSGSFLLAPRLLGVWVTRVLPVALVEFFERRRLFRLRRPRPGQTRTDCCFVQHPAFLSVFFLPSNSRPFVRLQAGHLSRPTFTRRTPIYHQSNPSLHFVSLYPPIALSTSSPPQNEQILNGLCIKDVVPATVKVSLGKGPASEHFDSAVPQISITRSFRHLSFSTTHPF